LAGLLGIPVAVGIAILKYRLYDIDVIINRPLVYGSPTALLAAVYFGGVAATQAILHTLTGQERQPQLAVGVSTLVIAALFNPLRGDASSPSLTGASTVGSTTLPRPWRLSLPS
jgi:hypothetical protein